MLEAFNSLGFFTKLKATQAYHSYRSRVWTVALYGAHRNSVKRSGKAAYRFAKRITTNCPERPRLVLKPVAQFNKNLPGIIPVEPAKRDAIVEFDTSIGHVERIQRGGDALAEVFADR